jgi:hypothetical protein
MSCNYCFKVLVNIFNFIVNLIEPCKKTCSCECLYGDPFVEMRDFAPMDKEQKEVTSSEESYLPYELTLTEGSSDPGDPQDQDLDQDLDLDPDSDPDPDLVIVNVADYQSEV